MSVYKIFKKMICIAAALSVVGAACPVLPAYAEQAEQEKVDGTTGTPLGGFGAGAVKFNAMNGSFAAVTAAPADQNDYKKEGESRFQFYSSNGGKTESRDILTAQKADGRYCDDAVWPEHMVDFGVINGIEIKMTAFSPLDSENYDNMSMPYAFYELELRNSGSDTAEAAAALLWDTSQVPVKIDNKGFATDERAVFAQCDDGIISAGSGNEFFETGVCETGISGTKNRTAVKVTLESGESKTIRFVLSWYDNSDPDGAYYLGIYNNAAEIAGLGLENFSVLKKNADELVNRMRGSDIPDWFVNQCLNSLVNISNNSIYKKDGRTAFAEGEWTCFGTMDQMWHARQIINLLIPQFAWQELEYWARTQRNDGQIHHDFNYMADTSVKYKLVDWDDTEHADYRNIDKWVDLNCAFIISVYEAYMQTGNEEKLSYFFPYMKKAGQRIFDQVELYGDPEYPYTFEDSENSYDAGGDPNAYNTSISAVAYRIMNILCEKEGDQELAQKYAEAYETVKESYRKKYLNNNFPTGRISESYFAGQWLSIHLRLGQIWSQEETDYVLECLDDYYHPLYKTLGYPQGTYDEWTPYMLTHYGGLLLHTQRQSHYAALQKESYNRQFKNRNYVFNHPLDILPSVSTANYAATNISGDKQYISIPSIWRNYYDVIGYQRNAATKELWLEPILLPEMNHKMTDAAYVSSEGWGTISCIETTSDGSEAYQNKNIIFKPDNEIYVSTLYLEDNFGDSTDSISVKINGEEYPFERTGEGYSRALAVEYNGTVTDEGINIVTEGDPGKEPPPDPEKPDDIEIPPVTAEMSAFRTIEAEKYSSAGGVSVAEDNVISYVTECDDQDYVKYDGVGFEDGAKAIRLRVRSTKSSHIELALGLVSGETVQNIEIPDTGGEWQEIRCEFDSVISGTDNVVFRFRTNDDESNRLVDIDSFVFEYKYQIPNQNWSASASKNADAAGSAFDRNPATRWNSSYQEGNEWYLLDLGDIYEFNKIKLDNSASSKDYPRRYEVYVSEDGQNFGSCIASGAGASGETDITFIRCRARYIKICQTGSAPSNYWSINEIYVYNNDEEYGDGNQTPPPQQEDPTVDEYTFVGTEQQHPNGAKYFDLEKYNTGEKSARINTDDNVYAFDEDIDEETRKLFADSDNSAAISKSYTGYMINYIGCSGDYNVKPAITTELKAGKYKLYYIGGNANDITVGFENGNGTAVYAAKRDFADGLVLHEIMLSLDENYSGDITFYNSSTWLPDLYAVKIVDASETRAELDTDTVYTADMLTNNISEHSTGWYTDDPELTGNYTEAGEPFGSLADFENKYRFYTTADITKTIYIPKKGSYRLDLLMREYTGRGYTVTLTNGETTEVLDCISNQIKIAKLESASSSVNMGIAYAYTGVLEPGIYSLTFTGTKVNLFFAMNMSINESGVIFEVAEQEDGRIKAEVRNSTDTAVKLQLIAASYNSDGSLDSVQLGTAAELEAGEKTEESFDIPEDCSYRIMLWDGMGTMKPIDYAKK